MCVYIGSNQYNGQNAHLFTALVRDRIIACHLKHANLTIQNDQMDEMCMFLVHGLLDGHEWYFDYFVVFYFYHVSMPMEKRPKKIKIAQIL